MDNSQQSVIRLSLRWIVFGFISIAALGFVGGMFGSQLYTPTAPLGPQSDQLVTTVQEVTVAPSTNTQSIVQTAQRSILLLATGDKSNPLVFATASVITNDGILISHHSPARGDVFAIDNAGTYIDIETVGQDAIYGVWFYRIRNGLLPSLELATANPSVGVDMLALSRSAQTIEPTAHTYSLTSYTIPAAGNPSGWHRVANANAAIASNSGTPLLLDDGKLIGISAANDTPTIIPITYIRRSLERLTTGNREYNPFEEFGFTVQPAFTPNTNETGIEFAFEVTSVSPDGPAGQLRANDQLIAINEQELTWDANISNLLSAQQPIILQVRRGSQEHTIQLTQPTPGV